MTDEMPEPALIFKAIDLYLRLAYAPGGLPKAVAGRVEQLKQSAGMASCPAVEHDRNGRHVLRLGNRFYPHMKLCLEPRPDGRGYLFRADTHDRHVRPAEGTRDAELFKQVVTQNATLAKEIESAWAQEGIPTFRTYLKEDLARRAELAKGGSS